MREGESLTGQDAGVIPPYGGYPARRSYPARTACIDYQFITRHVLTYTSQDIFRWSLSLGAIAVKQYSTSSRSR
jgi:hypothetical protein